jgi:hypothetical protein
MIGKMNTCANCKHWDTDPDVLSFVDRPSDFRLCALTVYDDGVPTVDSLATAVDASGYHAGLFTSPKFGCVQWESPDLDKGVSA